MSIFRKNRNIYQEYGSNKLEEQLSCRQDVESELRAAEFAVDYLEVEKEMMNCWVFFTILEDCLIVPSSDRYLETYFLTQMVK